MHNFDNQYSFCTMKPSHAGLGPSQLVRLGISRLENCDVVFHCIFYDQFYIRVCSVIVTDV